MILKTSALRQLYSFLSTRPSLWSTPNEHREEQLPTNAFLRDLISNFLDNLEYRAPDDIFQVRKTYQALYSEFSAFNDFGDDGHFEALCQVAATMAELSYPDHPYEVQLQIGRFSWYVAYIDDLGHTFRRSSLEGFQGCVLAKEAPDGAFLQGYRDHLIDMYKFWDVIPANSIMISAMEFVNGYLLEGMPVLREMQFSNTAHAWPYHVRAKTGGATAYAYMIFPKEINPNMSGYIQVVEDIGLYINLANDILSYYKEVLAGEKNNYIHIRSHVSQKSISDTLQDLYDDALAAHTRITNALKSTDAYIPWKRFVNGYTAFHLALPRYHLKDLGL